MNMRETHTQWENTQSYSNGRNKVTHERNYIDKQLSTASDPATVPSGAPY